MTVNSAGVRISDKRFDHPSNQVVDSRTAFAEEFRALDLRAGSQPTALCLSGGGIRSAAFSLGVIQALAAAGLLKHFHYLSTVSGGGYIGGWLTRLIGSSCECPFSKAPGPIKLADIENKLLARSDGLECTELRALRRYTSYLAPRLGPASADLWAGILLWIRNTFVNWLVFTPLLIAVVGLPICYVLLMGHLASWGDRLPGIAHPITLGLGFVALAFLATAMYRGIRYIPTHNHPGREWWLTTATEFGPGSSEVFRRIVVPMLAWCLLAPAAAIPIMQVPHETIRHDLASVFAPDATPKRGSTVIKAESGGFRLSLTLPERIDPPAIALPRTSKTTVAAIVALAILAASMIAYGVAWLEVMVFDYRGNRDNFVAQTTPFRTNQPAWLASCGVSALFNAAGICVGTEASLLWIVILGPPWVLLAEILRTTLYVAFRRNALRGDLDREWLARLSGTTLSLVLTGTVGGAIVLLGPKVIPDDVAAWSALVGGGAASGTAIAVFGKSARTMLAARRPDGTPWFGMAALAGIAVCAFAVILLILTGRVAGVLAWATTAWALPACATSLASAHGPSSDLWLRTCSATAAGLTLLLVVVALSLAVTLGRWINLNNFSMHAVYRNRLVRAFLGTARPGGDWRPDRYTHFDPSDNARMVDCFGDREPPALLHIVNVALNCTTGKDMARAERKAESFSISPFRCGSGSLLGPGEDGIGAPRGAYAKTALYAGQERETGPGDQHRGISLGTAIAISGAAASPNMGYHSSPLIAFIMTLFNVRLGAWLPNPGARLADLSYLRNSDADSIAPMLQELAGRSDDKGKYAYFSDGGHFDNLALYEMLRRRCRFMLVVDAGQDESYGYADLRIAIQNAGVDLGVRLKFPDALEIGQSALNPFGVLATVVYPKITGQGLDERPEEDGRILYLKPWLPKESPAELRAFKVLKTSFPHENTANQFFTESDFESYRALGRYIGARALETYRRDDPAQRSLRPGETAMDRFISGLRS